MSVLITIIHVVVALFLIVSVLLQSGKGGGVGAAFGGASTQVFGGHGAGGFLAKVTSVMAVTFMITSFILSYIGTSNSSVMKGVASPVAEEAPVAAAAAPAAPVAAEEAAPAAEAPAAVANEAASDSVSE